MERKNDRLGFCTTWVFRTFSILFASVLLSARAETDPRYYAVMVSAQVQSSPAQIQLRWEGDNRATGYTIARRDGGSWNNVGNAGGSATSWTDSNVSVGGAYEYRVTKSTSSGYTGYGYLYAGIDAPLIENRGKVILLVDNTYASDLAAELRRLEWDLAGDGWIVLRRDVSRNDSPSAIKNIIKSHYNSDPGNTKAVFLFGHIAVPYSGNFNPDGHPDHQGAWPADVYYGDLDGNWTDSSTYSGGAQRPPNKNAPGDGKFDQSDMPSAAEIAVGRVDFYNMTCYANKTPSRSERDLLRAYLNKDHNFRHRVFSVARRGLICDNFGERQGEAFAASGWRNFGAFFGTENVTKVGGWQYFSTVGTQDYLWSYGTGGGSWYTCDGVGSSDDFARTEIKSVFTMFLGSYFGDWDNESNFLRASLGSGYCLTTSWSGRPHWYYHHMGLGETIGLSTILSQNNGFTSTYDRQNYGTRGVHAALLGDPTLRMHPVIPPANLRGTANGEIMTLTWSPSSDNALVGYHVYRGGGPNGNFTRLTSSPIRATAFTDESSTRNATYMVRAVKLESAGGGTYHNPSQGVFFPENGSGGGDGGGTVQPNAPLAPVNLAATVASASQINLNWADNANNETGYRVERKTGQGGSWSVIATLAADSNAYNNTGLSPATTYYYRVLAFNDAGSSPASNEGSATTTVANPTPAGASFVGSDTNTSGNWVGTYGIDGYNIITGPNSYPGYAQVAPSGQFNYQWSDYSSETRALERPSGGGRYAAAWFSQTSFIFDVNLTDGTAHKLTLYFLDWDRLGRSQQVEILDASSGAVLDSRTISDFANGVYLSWNVKGSVRVRCTKISGNNAVVMGLFFDPGAAPIGGNTKISTKAGIMSRGGFNLEITGQTGRTYDVFASTNLQTWAKLNSVTLTTNAHNFLDTTSSGNALRFYRVVQIP
jgi:hypothetical protein